MPIYDQSFRHYDGPRTFTRLWWPIAREVTRPMLKARFTWVIGVFVLIQTVMAGILMYGFAKAMSMGGNSGAEMTRMLRSSNLPIDLDLGLNTLLFRFLRWNSLIMLLAVMMGQGCIAIDKKHQALPLYFSRPLKPRDYLLGKFLGLVMLPLTALTIAVVAIFAIAAGLFYDLQFAIGELMPVAATLVMLVLTVSMLALSMTAFSGLTVKPNAAAFMFLGFWMVSSGIAQAVSQATRREEFGALAPSHALTMLSSLIIRPDWDLLQRDDQFLRFNPALALVSVLAWAAAFLYLSWRNLRTVEVVK